MWSAIQWLVVRIAAIRWLFKLGWVGLLIPIVLILITIGLPIFAVLSIVEIPILILLVLFGLPIFLVLLFGSLLMGFLGFVLMIGLAALKFGLFVVLPIWLIWKLVKTAWCWGTKRYNGGSSSGDTPPSGPSASSGNPPGDASDEL